MGRNEKNTKKLSTAPDKRRRLGTPYMKQTKEAPEAKAPTLNHNFLREDMCAKSESQDSGCPQIQKLEWDFKLTLSLLQGHREPLIK